MVDAIREILIKVAIQNGNMKLGPLDTSAAIDSIRKFREDAENEIGRIRDRVSLDPTKWGGTSPTSDNQSSLDSQTTARPQRSGIKKAAEELRTWFSDMLQIQDATMKVGRSGKGQTVRDRDKPRTRDKRPPADRSGHTNKFNTPDEVSSRKRTESKAAPRVLPKGGKATSTNALKFASDLANPSVAKLARQILKLAASADSDIAMAVQNVSQFKGVFDAATKAAGGGLTVLTGGLLILGAELLATKIALEQAAETNRRYFESITNDAARTMEFEAKSTIRHSRQASSLALDVPDISEFKRNEENFKRSEERESKIRSYEESNASPAMKASFRDRMTTRGLAEERHTEIEDKLKFNRQQLAVLDEGDARRKAEKANFGTYDRTKLSSVESEKWGPGAARNAISAAESEVKHTLDESTPGFWGRQLYRGAVNFPIEAISGMNMGVDKSGYFNSQIDKKDLAESRLDDVKLSAHQNNSELHKEEVKSAQERFRLEQDTARLTKERLTTTKAIQQSAYEAVRAEKDRVMAGEVSFGTSSLADQNRVLRLQKKHKAIEAKKAENIENGRPERENLPQYTLFEMQHGLGTGNVSERTVREQARETAKAKGFEMESDLEQKEQELKDVTAKDTKPEEFKEMVQASFDVEKGATRIAEAIRSAIPFEELVAQVEKKLKDAADERKDNSFFRSGVFY